MSARIRVSLILALALTASILFLLGGSWLVRQAIYPASGSGSGLRAQYYPNTMLGGTVQRQWVESHVVLKGTGLSPHRTDDYSLRLSGLLFVTLPGYYELGTASDDDSWLYLDGALLVDNHGEHPIQRRMSGVWLSPGPHLLEVEYVQRKGDASLQLWWRPFWKSAPSFLPADLLKPFTRPVDHFELRELGYAVRARLAEVAAVFLTVLLMLAAGLWAPGGRRRVLALLFAVTPLTILSILPQISLDLWCDELVSLMMFSIQPISATMGEYPFPNNHILYNLINNIGLRVADSHNLGQVMASPFALRLLSLGYSIAALAWLYRAMMRHFSYEAAWLGALVLATALPFASFATQLRGYSFSLLLSVVLLDLWLRFLKRPLAGTGLVLALINGALIWVIPANVYFCVSMLVLTVPLLWLPQQRKQALMAAAWLTGGLVLGILLYHPVWPQVLKESASNGFFMKSGIIFNLMIEVWDHLLAGRYLLLPGLFFGGWLLCRHKSPTSWYVIGAASLLIVPFLLFWVHGSEPYQRIFLLLVLPSAVLAGVLLAAPLKLLAWGRPLRWTWLGTIFLICVCAYGWNLSKWQIQVEAANLTGRMVQNLSYAYYLHRFNPRQTVLNALKYDQCIRHDRIIFDMNVSDGGALFEYAKHYGLVLKKDAERAAEIVSQGGCSNLVERGERKPPPLPEGQIAMLTPLNGREQFYRLYLWGPVTHVQAKYQKSD
jgi:hypothetical protein